MMSTHNLLYDWCDDKKYQIQNEKELLRLIIVLEVEIWLLYSK